MTARQAGMPGGGVPTSRPGPVPHLSGPRAPRPEAIALVLHGGQEESTEPTSVRGLAVLRMLPIARDIERRSRGRIGAVRLRDAVRGWNGPLESPVGDAGWALDQVHERYPGLPVGLVGHSMGGRVALELAGREDVRSVVALAPWLADAYGEAAFTDTPLLVVHGSRDSVTDPRASAGLVRRVRAAGGDATYLSITDRHAMLWRYRAWHRAASTFLMDTLLTKE